MNVDYRDMNGTPALNELPFQRDRIAQIASSAAKLGLRMYFVIGGDRMAGTVVDALEDVNAVTPLAGRGWVLNHVPFADQELIGRVAKLQLRITAYSGSEFERSHADFVKAFGQNAKAYEDASTPLGWWQSAGVDVGMGTDEAANPMFSIWHALTRQNIKGESMMSDGKRINRRQALQMYTINGAKVMGWDNEIGSIEEGKLADMVVLDTDILNCADNEIRSAKPVATLVGGHVVFGRLQ